MQKYSNEAFRKIVGDKIGNVVFMKEKLREYGMIGEYAKLSDEHIDLFNKAKEVKKTQHKTWKDAFDQVLSSYASQQPQSHPAAVTPAKVMPSIPAGDPLVDALNRIADVLESIEKKL